LEAKIRDNGGKSSIGAKSVDPLKRTRKKQTIMGEILGVTQGKLSVGARKGEVGRGIGGVRTRSGVVKARKK
jgi:hypothetical protein